MNSPVAGVGSQEPRFCNAPRGATHHADDAAFLASGYGLEPDDWQRLTLRAWLSETAGKWSSGRCGLAVPRQNGKNAVLEMVELYKMVVLGRKILHTAHEVKTARKAFLRLKGFFENERMWPELAAMKREIRQTNGQEAIVLHSQRCGALAGGSCDCPGGGSCEFVARSRGSGRGFTVDDLVCDEAQELTDEQLEALLPTISSAPSGNPQQIYTGTPPPPGSFGTVFRRMRDVGISGKDKRLAWVEWSVAEVGNIRDRARWAATNPALGLRLQSSVIEDEVEQMTVEGFARERLGWWVAVGLSAPTIEAARWQELAVPSMPADAPRAFGVKFSPSGDRVAVAVASPHGDEVTVEVILAQEAGAGLGEIEKALARNVRTGIGVAIDGRAGSAMLAADLGRLGVRDKKITVLNTSQAIEAHSKFLDMTRAGTVHHTDQPGLTASVASSTKRPIGRDGGWGWAPLGESGDSLPLEAATLAAWLAAANIKTKDPASKGGGWRVVTL